MPDQDKQQSGAHAGSGASTDQVVRAAMTRQARIGLALAAAIILSWVAVHCYAMFVFRWSLETAPLAIAIVLVQTWLYVGLFIIAHDCMHGSLVPLHPRANRNIGQICLGLYAGFWYDFMNRKHHLHHRYSGTAEDPDFNDDPPYAFWPWYFKFFREYFSGREIIVIGLWVWVYILALGVPVENIIAFFALPAIASSVQLFTFGTYLPHRPGRPDFEDRHRTRSNGYPWFVSLLTCFHFGYHHEHHAVPDAPWWRLPALRRGSAGR